MPILENEQQHFSVTKDEENNLGCIAEENIR